MMQHISKDITDLMRHIQPNPDKVVEAATTIFGVSRTDLLAKDRHQCVNRARMGCTLVLRRHGFSFPEIGRALKRDHTTAISSLARAELLERTSEQFCGQVQLIEELIRPKYLKLRIETDEAEETREEVTRGVRILHAQR